MSDSMGSLSRGDALKVSLGHVVGSAVRFIFGIVTGFAGCSDKR